MVYAITKHTLGPIYRLWLRRINGLENLPKDGQFIIALNHASYYETILPYITILPKLNKQMHALVNSRYWKFLPARIIINWGKCIPVYVGKDSDPKKNEIALKKAKKFLEMGHLIQIFPEGTRSNDGKLKKSHSGVARLAIMAKVPVVPVGIVGSDKVMPKGKIFPRFKRCEMNIGKPMHFNKYYNKKLNNKDFDKITRSIMKEIAKLIGQEYNY